MNDKPISLSKVRKARARSEAKRKADANSVKFGRTKAERSGEKARRGLAEKQLDAHRKSDDR